MTVFSASAASAAGGRLVRGMPTRHTDLMELFQSGVVRAFAAAAGCNVGRVEIDNGIDMDLFHELPGQDEIMLRLQLKSTSGGWNAARTDISAPIARTRYDQMRRPNPSFPSIVVIMDLPPDQSLWAWSRHPYTAIRHCAYWVSLRNEPAKPGDSKKVTVSAPSTNVFDDVALCQIMARIRAGGHP